MLPLADCVSFDPDLLTRVQSEARSGAHWPRRHGGIHDVARLLARGRVAALQGGRFEHERLLQQQQQQARGVTGALSAMTGCDAFVSCLVCPLRSPASQIAAATRESVQWEHSVSQTILSFAQEKKASGSPPASGSPASALPPPEQAPAPTDLQQQPAI